MVQSRNRKTRGRGRKNRGRKTRGRKQRGGSTFLGRLFTPNQARAADEAEAAKAAKQTLTNSFRQTKLNLRNELLRKQSANTLTPEESKILDEEFRILNIDITEDHNRGYGQALNNDVIYRLKPEEVAQYVIDGYDGPFPYIVIKTDRNYTAYQVLNDM